MKPLFAYILFIVTSLCYSQTAETFDSFFNNVLNTITLDAFYESEDSLTVKKVANFDFLKIQPVLGVIDTNDFYKVYYDTSNTIVKVKRVHNFNKLCNYSIFIERLNATTTKMMLTIANYKDPEHTIMINNSKKELFAIKMISLFKIKYGCIDDYGCMEVRKKLGVNDISSAFLLDKYLNVINKLIFYKGNLTSFSEIKKENNERIERMMIYRDNRKIDFLNGIPFKKFIRFLYIGRGYEHGAMLSLKAKPFQKSNIPLFFFNSHSYL